MNAIRIKAALERPRFHGSRALTLVEMLCVITIISLVTATLSVSLASADHGAQVLRSVAAVRELDVRARLYARTQGVGVQMILDSDGHSAKLVSTDGQILSQMEFASDCSVRVSKTLGAALVVFDRQGHSEDYSIQIENDGRSRWFRVCGLTGLILAGVPAS